MTRPFSLALVVWLVVSPSGTAQSSAIPAKIQPQETVAGLPREAGDRFDFIVRGTPSGLESAAKMIQAQPRPLPFISGAGISLTMRQAIALAARQDIDQIWYVPAELYPTYVRVVQAVEYSTKNLPSPGVINMSLGPPAEVMPLAGNDDEPMNAATRKAADSGFVVVMAIGNYGEADDGIVNPWCHPEWVICVGAASADATRVWPASARGAPSDPKTWPVLVANGIDVISAWPMGKVKSESRRKRDEENLLFQQTVAKDKWDIHTIESGTSQATAQVSRAAGLIIGFVRSVALKKGSVKAGDPLFAITVPADRLAATSKRGPRLTGDVRSVPGTTDSEITYRLVEPWKLVKQLLMDTAVPMSAFPPHVVGAGFVDPNYVEQQFSNGEKIDLKIAPIKVME